MKIHYETPLVQETRLSLESGFLTTSNLNIQSTTQDGQFWDDSADL